MRTFVAVMVAVVPGVAYADDAAPSVTTSLDRSYRDDASPFVTLFHQDGATHLDFDASYMFPKTDAGESVTILRADLFAQYVDHKTGLGGYATVPFTHVSSDQPGSMSVDTIGGLEIGGVFAPHLDVPNLSLVFHAGVALPTAPSDLNQGLSNTFASLMRLTEFYGNLPSSTTLRLGVSPTFRSGQVFARFDANVDSNLSNKNNGDIKPGIELDAGIGVTTGQVTLMAEVTNLIITGSDGGTVDVGAISARFDLGLVKPYVAVIAALDDDAKDIMQAAITVGISASP